MGTRKHVRAWGVVLLPALQGLCDIGREIDDAIDPPPPGVLHTLSNRGSAGASLPLSWTQRVTIRSLPSAFWMNPPPEYSRALSASEILAIRQAGDRHVDGQSEG